MQTGIYKISSDNRDNNFTGNFHLSLKICNALKHIFDQNKAFLSKFPKNHQMQYIRPDDGWRVVEA